LCGTRFNHLGKRGRNTPPLFFGKHTPKKSPFPIIHSLSENSSDVEHLYFLILLELSRGCCILGAMKNNKMPIVGKIQDINNKANEIFADEIFMPMVKFAGVLLFAAIVVDYGAQLIEAVDTLAR